MKKILLCCFVVSLASLLTNCNNGNSELEKQKLALEKQKLDIESKKLDQNSEGKNKSAETMSTEKKTGEKSEGSSEKNDEANRREIASNASKANRFQNYTDAVVVVGKTFFYNMPDESTRKSAFLIQGDRITVEKSQRNFVYTTFTNEATGRTTVGWLKSEDFEPIDSYDEYDY